MISQRDIRLTVNGVSYEGSAEPRMTLVDFLRHELGLVGTHVGCEHGVCGACTILMDGKAVRSCIMLAAQADGADLMTVEGLAKDAELHPIQQAFMEERGLQCGFCTPGFMMSIHELLQTTTDPSDEEIRDALGGAICRCTGYESILKSVRNAAAKLRAST
ncbi:MAG: (2Fe-2S)-binding protein [Chloroflexi bacterium]|nr:(2Fe-2S)-binding protein [Chloroflexota bacterium]